MPPPGWGNGEREWGADTLKKREKCRVKRVRFMELTEGFRWDLGRCWDPAGEEGAEPHSSLLASHREPTALPAAE